MKYNTLLRATLAALTTLCLTAGAHAYSYTWGNNTDTHSGTPGDWMEFSMNILDYANGDVSQKFTLDSYTIENTHLVSGTTAVNPAIAFGGFDPTSSISHLGTGNPLADSYAVTWTGFTNSPYKNENGDLVAGTTAPGMYQSTINLLGKSFDGTDLRISLPFFMEVVQSFDSFQMSVIDPVKSTQPGGSVAYSVLCQNTGGRDVYLDRFYISDYTRFNLADVTAYMASPSSVPAGASAYIPNVFSLETKPTTPTGTGIVSLGAMGGYYAGDYHQFQVGDFQLNVTAVPEPSSLVALAVPCVLLAGGLRRRFASS